MNSEIILIGPIGSGKTTVAELLHTRTMLPHRSMDGLRWTYYDEIGYDWNLAKENHIKDGFWGLYRYWKPFEAYAVKRILEDFSECIFDFGGSHSVYRDDELFEQVRQTLEPYPFVILLIPSPDKEESIRILNARNNYASDDQRMVNEIFVRHHSNYDLAKHTVYTRDKTPEQTCEEILLYLYSNDWIYET
jgi:shikimate kinase